MKRITHSSVLNFITITVVDWIDIFTRREYKDFIIECLQHCQEKKGLEIYEYVIMTNHLHLIVCDTTNILSDVLRDFKTYTSKQLFKMIEENPQESRKEWILKAFKKAGQENSVNKNHQLWQNENYPVALMNNEITAQKQQYIHQNPVKAGFVSEPYQYYYSSANLESPLKVMKLL
ncbi:MAG: transposase [Cytophagales bacterium]|nr:MAG: transposase [Cytophagales bacterium]